MIDPITLPVKPSPNTMEPELVDQGFVQRGASSLRVDRPGSRWRFMFGWPIMSPETADTFTAPLARAKRKGLRINIPRLVDQGTPGAPVVDGSGQAGTSIALRGFNPGYIVRVGFWLTLVDASGHPYVHRVVETVVADGSGDAVVEIEPALRRPHVDGSTVEMQKPYVVGFIDSENMGYQVPTDKYLRASLTIEEYR